MASALFVGGFYSLGVVLLVLLVGVILFVSGVRRWGFLAILVACGLLCVSLVALTVSMLLVMSEFHLGWVFVTIMGLCWMSCAVGTGMTTWRCWGIWKQMPKDA